MAEGEARKENCRTTTTTSAAFPLTLLNDDILTEIFLRLPHPATLLRCALTDKRHLRLISDPTFLRRFRHLHPDPCPLLGFFFFWHTLSTHSFLPLFVPDSNLDTDLTAISRALHFTPPLDDGSSCSTNWNLRDCTAGLLLYESSEQQRLAVIDPLTPRRRFFFPFPPASASVSAGWDSYFYLIVHESDDNSPIFQVVCIKKNYKDYSDVVVVAAIFSSSSGKWRSLPMDILLDLKIDQYFFGQVMRGNGNLYWSDEDQEFMLVLDVASMQLSICSLPGTGYLPMVGETRDGMICIGDITESMLRI